MENLIHGVAILTDPFSLFLILAGTLGGVVIGALPGLSSTMAVALLLPFTVTLPAIPAIAMLAALYCSGTYGGSITAILINSPGTPAASATAFDGYPLAVKGQAGRALGLSVWSSFVGGTFSVFVLILAAPLLARLAYNFGAPEYFGLAVFGLSMLASISGKSAVKNLIGGAFGLLVATVGTDFTTGVERFTFGYPELTDGINFIPVMIGIFGISEMLTQAGMLDQVVERIAAQAVKLPTLQDFKKVWKCMLRSCGIGTFIGLLPAEGGTVAAMISYSEAKRWSKEPETFGEGAIEGVVGPETANNAATGAAMVPTLALGIPGSGTTAVILGALMVHGLRPGPHLFLEQPTFLYSIFTAMLVANLIFLGLGMVGAKVFARITLIPRTYLWPAVFVLAMVGSYSLQQSVADIYIMLAFGLIGYVGRRHGFSPAPVIMGVVLGPMVENTLKQSLIIFDHNWLRFFERPIVDVFFVLTILGLFSPLLFKLFQNRK